MRKSDLSSSPHLQSQIPYLLLHIRILWLEYGHRLPFLQSFSEPLLLLQEEGELPP